MTSLPHTVSHAIASGKRGALSIDLYLKGLNRDLKPFRIGEKISLSMKKYLQGGEDPSLHPVVPFEKINLSYFEPEERGEVRSISERERQKGFKEVNLGFPRDLTIQEANRCFSCGLCNHCDNCLNYCPDTSILKMAFNEVDYEYCKGCGICENECPVGFIQMEKEETA
jgi:Pyruvate/2-oxoacid:ferredoxin oxidoreductase delta subunit